MNKRQELTTQEKNERKQLLNQKKYRDRRNSEKIPSKSEQNSMRNVEKIITDFQQEYETVSRTFAEISAKLTRVAKFHDLFIAKFPKSVAEVLFR